MNKKNQELVAMMCVGVVTFSYLKKDGTTRIARGTLSKEMCPKVESSERKTSGHLQIYYDVDKKAWRCFVKDNLLTIKDKNYE